MTILTTPTEPKAGPMKARRRQIPLWLIRLGRERLALGAAIIVMAHILVALLGPWITPYDAFESFGPPLELPGAEFALGTDMLGRDLLSRIILGGRTAMFACFFGIAIATLIGAVIGLVAGLFGGLVDECVMRVVDTLQALPEFLLLSMLILGFGSGPGTLIVILAVVYMPGITRTVRARSKALSALDFVRAAELRGESRLSIIWRELLPNTLSLLSVEFAIRFSSALLRLSALSFLGVGVKPPIPDWGTMVQEAVGLLASNPVMLIAPALCLMTLVVSLNFAIEGLARILGVSRT